MRLLDENVKNFKNNYIKYHFKLYLLKILLYAQHSTFTYVWIGCQRYFRSFWHLIGLILWIFTRHYFEYIYSIKCMRSCRLATYLLCSAHPVKNGISEKYIGKIEVIFFIIFSFFIGILRELRIDSIQNKFESEVLAAQQNLEVSFYLLKYEFNVNTDLAKLRL